jgi:sugar/nucleoside kinase (ribokinase family)
MTHHQAAPVLIVGSMALDDLQLPTTTATNVVGGAATYASLATSLFGPARVVAVVGSDFPETVLADLQRREIDTEGIWRAAGRTFRWSGRYSKNLASRTTLDTQLNVFADFRPVLPNRYRDTPYLLLANIHPALQLEVLDQVSHPRFVAADTMNFWIEGERPTLEAVLQRIDTLVINDEELRQLAGEHNIKRAASTVLSYGPQRLIVKRGEHGAMLFDPDGVFFAPAYPLDEEIDPTGAGDTFAGALLGYLARSGQLTGPALREALMTASAVASFCVEDVGTQRLASLSLAEASQRLESLRALVRG